MTAESDQTDYASWSHADLIARISALESRLREQNVAHSTPPSPQRPAFKKPKKASKPFDPSRYHTRLIALKFAYLGGNYNGFEHHSNNKTPLPTIEEEIWKALRKCKLIFPSFKEGRSEEEVEWEGCEYSKCGRTDRGVSAFGQVIGVRVRSARPKAKERRVEDVDAGGQEGIEGRSDMAAGDGENQAPADEDGTGAEPAELSFDPVKDELPYLQLLNRVLPPDIRILAWCPNPPEDFSARFNCKERRYRYFFTNPAYPPLPGSNGRGDGWLDIEAMQEAAQKYEGLHDFRNFCKIDASKQITNFERRIFHAGIHAVGPEEEPANLLGHGLVSNGGAGAMQHGPRLYWFEVRGSAFLWHQVRHLIAVLFLVGQGLEKPSVVDDLLDVEKTPSRPLYDMASDTPLVLWDCIFPDPTVLEASQADHQNSSNGNHVRGYEDGLDWIYVGDSRGGQDGSKRNPAGVEDGKYGRGGVMEDLWALWRKRKMDEVLAGSLMNVVARQGSAPVVGAWDVTSKSDRTYDGGELPRTVGTYTPIMLKARTETFEVVNQRYAERKGLVPKAGQAGAEIGTMDIDE